MYIYIHIPLHVDYHLCVVSGKNLNSIAFVNVRNICIKVTAITE